MPFPLAVIKRFEAKFEKSTEGCWLWNASVLSGGYAQFQMNGRPYKAHIIAYKMYVGPVPVGILVCHKCDVRHCVNPDHLFLGTQVDNMRDMKSKGRDNYPYGTKLPIAKLDPDKVREIRRLYASGVKICRLARMFDVTHVPIRRLLNGETWKQVS